MKFIYRIGVILFFPFQIINDIAHKAEKIKIIIAALLMIIVAVGMLYLWWMKRGFLRLVLYGFAALSISGILIEVFEMLWNLIVGILLVISNKPAKWYFKCQRKCNQVIDIHYFIEKEKHLKVYRAKYYWKTIGIHLKN